MHENRPYTVSGLINDNGAELYVAGVFDGHLIARDKEATSQAGGQELSRYTAWFTAESPQAAQELAYHDVAYGDENEEEGEE